MNCEELHRDRDTDNSQRNKEKEKAEASTVSTAPYQLCPLNEKIHNK
jgi:hypothetical protein